jgi:hypothetical protein
VTPELLAAAQRQAERQAQRRDDLAFGAKVAGLIVAQVALFLAAMLAALIGHRLAGVLGQGIGLALGLIALGVVTLIAFGRTFDT